MKSPRFPLRETTLRRIISHKNFERVWSQKVRNAMRKQFIPDPLDHLDFHQAYKRNCLELERRIRAGTYTPGASRRILVEKSKGLCRQLLIPNIWDAMVLQAFSDAMYQDIKDQAPTAQSFFEPSDEKFTDQDGLFTEPEYGSYRAWLDFQTQVFKFSKDHPYMVITDVANYYDTISYSHLRNIISSTIDVREPVLDMLIYVLSGLLWQPDYMPRVEIGLPQINLDAPRILAHCFLYELDQYLESRKGTDFVRFMDDIDVGVSSIQEAKHVLKCIDLVLHTRQIRLNSGKTLILRRKDALRHFRIHENVALNKFTSRLNKKVARGKSVDRDRRSIARIIKVAYRRKRFDDGNGEKILKRLLSISARIGVEIEPRILQDIIIRRPACRTAALRVISRTPLNGARLRAAASLIHSAMVVDDAAYVETSNFLVETPIPKTHRLKVQLADACASIPTTDFFSLYARLWLTSKYGNSDELLRLCRHTADLWVDDAWLGRLVGSLYPVFLRSTEEVAFRKLIQISDNDDAIRALSFFDDLRRDKDAFDLAFTYIRAANPTKGTGISHARYLMLIAALGNPHADPKKIAVLKRNHKRVWGDAFYLERARSTTGLAIPSTPLRIYPVP